MNSKSKVPALLDTQTLLFSSSSISEDLEYMWLTSNGGTRIVCNGLGHQDVNDCIREFFLKLIDTSKVASKYYIFFHMIPLIIKLRKAKGFRVALNHITKSCYEYIKSLCFMAFLVGILRGAMCFTNHCAPSPSLKKTLLPGCLTSAGSILFESDSRRKEIGYFVYSKALRSSYICFKRVLGLKISNQQIGMHILVMSLLFYVYNHHGGSLKFKHLFDLVFGEE